MCEDRPRQKRRDFPFLSCHSPGLSVLFPSSSFLSLPSSLLPFLLSLDIFFTAYGVGGNVVGMNETNIC